MNTQKCVPNVTHQGEKKNTSTRCPSPRAHAYTHTHTHVMHFALILLLTIQLRLGLSGAASSFELSLVNVGLSWASRLAPAPPASLRQLQARGGRYRLLLLSAAFTMVCDEMEGDDACGAPSATASSVIAMSRDDILDARDADPIAAAGTDISTRLPSCSSAAAAAAATTTAGQPEQEGSGGNLSSWFRPSTSPANPCCKANNATECDFYPTQLTQKAALSESFSSRSPAAINDTGGWTLGTFPCV